MRTSTFKRNWMLHYIQPEYLYLPRKSEQPEPHSEGTTRVYFYTNNFNFFAEDGSGIILAVYDNKGKIIFCSHYKNNQGVHLYSEVYASAGSVSSRQYYYKIISTPYISTSYTIDSNDFLILPPGQYYYRYIRDTMQYAEIERYKLYNFTIPETESTGITSKFINIDGLSLEYLTIAVEANLKDISQEERWTVETGIYGSGTSVTYPTGGMGYSPYTLIGPSSYIILKYNIVQGNQIINTIERGKIPRANYSYDFITGFHTGKVGENDVYEIFRVNSVRQSLGTIQDYWIDYGRISGYSIAEYRGGYHDDFSSRFFVYIHDPFVRSYAIESQEDVVNSSISYNVQSAYFQVTYTYLLFGYTDTYYGVPLPRTINSINPDLHPATWQNTVDTFLSEAFKTIHEYTYGPQYTSISSNIPVNIIIGKENSWSEDGYYITDDIYVTQGDCELQSNSHNITYNFSIPSIDTSLMDGYEEIMFEAENWDLRNKKLNKNFYRYYNNGQDIPFYNV